MCPIVPRIRKYCRLTFYFRLFATGFRDSNQTSTTGIRARLRCNGEGSSANLCRPPRHLVLFQSFIVGLTKVARYHDSRTISLHFLRTNRARRRALRCRDPRAIPTCASRRSAQASRGTEYIFSLVSKVAGAGERESEMTREIYSRELSGTVQFSWIVGRGMRYCLTSPGLAWLFLIHKLHQLFTGRFTGCFRSFPAEVELFHDEARKRDILSDNYCENILKLAKSVGKFLG